MREVARRLEGGQLALDGRKLGRSVGHLLLLRLQVRLELPLLGHELGALRVALHRPPHMRGGMTERDVGEELGGDRVRRAHRRDVEVAVELGHLRASAESGSGQHAWASR